MDDIRSYFRGFSLYNIRGKNEDLPRIHPLDATTAMRYNTLGYFDEFRTKRITVKQKNGNMPEL
jgi:hypothetical protein